MPFGLQPIHIAVIVLVALLIFGPKQLPAIGRWVARTFNDLRKATNDFVFASPSSIESTILTDPSAIFSLNAR